ncbi:structural polyprotein [Chicken astrovirus]|uniref:Capsid polyprotein VP90 n=1 Tax=Avian nephritis virus 1 TaxID=336960 RepID=CAPSD_ANV1|nr:structural polyprotein [Chicken astrovirus]Q9JGF1.1 RecName: Full=Capsid polyprotein VP90 [Avian nephritis virus 1]BAA92849.1 structural polyprotein [Avian nephritis virus 1]
MAGGATAPAGAKPKQPKQKQKKPSSQARKKPSQKQKAMKPVKQELRKVEKQVRVLKARTNGPKVNDTMKTTVTVGTLVGQTQSGLNRQLRVSFNPLLMKSTEGGSTTPLSIRASMYEMWKPLSVEIFATPLSGFSSVVGSVGFMVITLNGLEASADSIDTIKARRHVQMALGRPYRLKLSARELAGPREGWWLVDTSEAPADAYGPAVDLMLAYATENLLGTSSGSTTSYTGTLWQVEMRVTYAFSTYNPKPGLQTLVSQSITGGQTVTIQPSPDDGSLIMTTNSQQVLALLTPRVAGQRKGKSQTIWAIAGSAVDAAATVLGPWGYLLKGGFWLVRLIFGGSSARNTTTRQYQIYPSVESALTDQPIFGNSTGTQSVTVPICHITEVVNPNAESNNLPPPTTGAQPQPQPPAPIEEILLPLAELTGQPGVPPLYTFDGSSYTPPTNWLGSTILLTGIPAHKRVTGNLAKFGVTNLQMSKVAATALEIYDFTDFGVFFGTGSYLSEGGIHTGKTLIYSLMSGQTPNPWLAANQSGTTWYMPSWAGFPQPGQGDYFLQMQDVTDTTTHTTSVNVYFLVAYRQSRRLIAFFNTGGTARPAPTSMLCLYNVDCGRAPQTPYPTFQSTLQSLNQIGVDAKSDPDSDDDISLAGSVIGDEFDSVDHLEREREDLMRRLRDLDLRRFQI